VLATEFEEFAILRHATDYQTLPARNHGDFAGELARLVAGN